MKRFLFNFSRISVGILFVISGILKGIDPLGTAFKIEEYFLHIFHSPYLISLSLPIALFLCAIEFTLGIALIFNVLNRFAHWTSIILLAVFTPLTLYLAIVNPVKDCGCFGDAIKLSNWQTFFKNILIVFLLLPFWIFNKDFTSKIEFKKQKMIVFTAFLLLVSFEMYNYSYLPVIDFRPYKVGVNIKSSMEVPPNAPKDIYKTTLIYKNKQTGEVKEFSEDYFPWNDTNWVWLETKTVLVKKGYVPPIHDFYIKKLNETDITDSILQADNVLLIISNNLETANIRGIRKVKILIDSLEKKIPNLTIYWLTASDKNVIKQFKDNFDLHNINFANCDETTLKTIIRANPGLVLLKNGTIIKKIHFHNITSKTAEKFEKLYK